ncbi:MAG: PolC-type DNA polymerase III [Clostridiales bacterium]|nr:PolC-type DNA polymerase III [Clostridiales bacterium]
MQELLGVDDNEQLEDCILKKTKVYIKERRWEIIIESPNYIDSQLIFEIEDSIKEKIGSIDDIRIIVNYPQAREWFYNNFEVAWEDIKNRICRDFPSCGRWLTNCRACFDGDELNLTFNNPLAVDLFDSQKINNYIENCIRTLFNLNCKVQMLIDQDELETHQEKYTAKKEQEDSVLIKEAINNNGQDNKFSKPGPGSLGKKGQKELLVLGKPFKGEATPIDELKEDSGRVIVKGQVFDIETRETRSGKIIFNMDITDYKNSITIKAFCNKDQADKISSLVKRDDWILIRGECVYDKYQRDVVIIFNDLMISDSEEREDNEHIKRVELHLHTQMSAMDGVSSVNSLVSRAAKWGHPAIAITDHGVLQAFPEAYMAGKKHGIKIIYGVEAYLVNDCRPMILNGNEMDFNQPVIVFDIETTGLDPKKDRITEIGAVKIVNKEVVDSFQTFVNPEVPIPAKITKLTGINDDMVKDAPLIHQALEMFKDFCGDAALAAHNAPFDIGFVREKGKDIGWKINNPIIDTLILSRELIQDLKRHRLDQVAKHFDIRLDNHHRAKDDATATGQILIKLFEMLEDMGIGRLIDINSAFTHITNINSLPSNHALILVKDKAGLKNLYKLVSKSHIDFFYRRPRIPKSVLMKYREGLIIGSGCEAGELYKAMVKGSPYNEVREIAQFYDFLEVQPIDNNAYLVREGYVEGRKALEKINKSIVKLGKKIGKPVVATGDVHFLDPQDEYFRRILMSGQGYRDADQQPPLYFKTTRDMLDDFKYLEQETAMEIVIHNPRLIADSVEEIQPIPSGLFTPEIPGAEEQISQMSWENAYRIYGDPLPDIVQKRLEKELNAIIKHGFAVLYLISHKLVKKSLADGYLVGSRGSVGSSFVAYMTDITEVNPLAPHYVCPKCKHSDFDIDKAQYGVGVDLPDTDCPKCGTTYKKDGYDIPFEVFLGFEGDKVPDIDLNFSGEYQPTAHKYTEELFGEGHVFRAGTIGTIAEKTAFGFVKKYLDERDMVVSNAEIKRLVAGCTGVKRTTGQHPGGIMVVPKSKEIYDFSPIQYPADAKGAGVITTHFDYNFIHENLVKLDILGHDDPTTIRMLEDITGQDARSIPLDDERTMSIFSGTEVLNLKPEDIGSEVGTFGIPEFGTRFVRQMLVDTKPTTFGELIRISGLSHGTDVWLNNAQDLIRNGIAQLSEVISTRDDIMIYLIYKGIEPTMAFQIMESVRRGRGLTLEFEEAMVSKNVPDWFIDSCKKIKYMFPKAHAAAYVIMAFRIAYFKVNYPHAFYGTYFTIKSNDFDAEIALSGKEAVRNSIMELESKGNGMTAKERSTLTILEVVLEMYCRNIRFLPVDLYQSHPTRFSIVDNAIRPPLNTLQGVGANAALSIAEGRKQGEFISVEDLRERTRITKTAIEVLRKHGALKDLPETSQLSLF